MPDNFIISFDGSSAIDNACLMISTKDEEGALVVLHTYHNQEAIHIWYILTRAHLDPKITLIEDGGN